MAKKDISKLLNSAPDPKNLRERGDGGKKIFYIPVGIVENMLDEVFGVGGWQTLNFKYTVIGNEIAGSIELQFFINGIWVSRFGAASAQIREYGFKHKKAGQKIPNALEMDLPHLLSDCLTNASKKLGKWFGRDLNRQHTDNFDEKKLDKLQEKTKPPLAPSHNRWPIAIQKIKEGEYTVDSLLDIFYISPADLTILKAAINENV